MTDGIAQVHDGHRTLFKWHRGRKHGTDLSFTGARILEGMRLGASVEVDLRRHADGGFAVLHDRTLDKSTTGRGPVVAQGAAALRELYLRDAGGQPTAHKVMLLEDLAGLIAAGEGISDSAILQLDLKESADGIDARAIASFEEQLGPVARHFILSGGDAAAVEALAAPLPDLAVGYDPCEGDDFDNLMNSVDFAGFTERAVRRVPRAKMAYLEYGLVLAAADAGFDIIAAFHAAGRTIDAYTIRSADGDGIGIAKRLIALKVDQITTDDPVGLDLALRA